MIKNLYKEDLMDHYQNPKNFGALQGPCLVSERLNPSCGDTVLFAVRVDQGVIQDVRFTGNGCVLSIAAASKLSEFVKGQPAQHIAQLDQHFMQELVGMQVGFSRMQCITLSLQALVSALKKGD
jgi:nitrogen fixation NifU-like protein